MCVGGWWGGYAARTSHEPLPVILEDDCCCENIEVLMLTAFK